MISIVICSIDQAKLAKVVRNYESLLRGEEFELIAITDARSLSEGYNRGFRRSVGSVVIFSHDDIEILSPDFAAKLRGAFQEHDVVGVVGTTALASARWNAVGQPLTPGVAVYAPGAVRNEGYLINVFGAATPIVGGIQALDGLFMAAKREVVETVPFDEKTFDAFHGYDADFSFSAYLAGFKLAVSAEIIVAHQSGGKYGAEWAEYSRRFIEKHGAKLYTGAAGPRRCAAAQKIGVDVVLRYCEPARLAEITAKLRDGLPAA